MPYQAAWVNVNIFDENGDVERYKRGDVVPDDAGDAEQISRLVIIGALRVLDSSPAVEERPPLVTLSDSVNDTDPEPPQRPPLNATVDEWRDYATDARNPNRLSREEADKLSKAELVKRFRD